MNTSQRPMIASPEAHLIADAVEGLRQSTGITGKILPQGSRAGTHVSLTVAGKSLDYHCEIKQKIDRFLTTSASYTDHPLVLNFSIANLWPQARPRQPSAGVHRNTDDPAPVTATLVALPKRATNTPATA
jgi:hypothetical protein